MCYLTETISQRQAMMQSADQQLFRTTQCGVQFIINLPSDRKELHLHAYANRHIHKLVIILDNKKEFISCMDFDPFWGRGGGRRKLRSEYLKKWHFYSVPLNRWYHRVKGSQMKLSLAIPCPPPPQPPSLIPFAALLKDHTKCFQHCYKVITAGILFRLSIEIDVLK